MKLLPARPGRNKKGHEITELSTGISAPTVSSEQHIHDSVDWCLDKLGPDDKVDSYTVVVEARSGRVLHEVRTFYPNPDDMPSDYTSAMVAKALQHAEYIQSVHDDGSITA